MTYKKLLKKLDDLVNNEDPFPRKAHSICASLSALTPAECLALGSDVHVIPECYGHDSTHEKLYAKASDALVSSIFTHFGLTARVLDERGDAADVIAQSAYQSYSFVADSKVFRLSRTAKNQKDFKVTSMAHWKGDCDYAALVCPLYQYPSRSSAIYAQALDHNVALLSFEHILFLLEAGAKETARTSFGELFSYPEKVSKKIKHSERKSAAPLLDALNTVVCRLAGRKPADWQRFLRDQALSLSKRAKTEVRYWESERTRYKSLTRDEAIAELIALANIDSKIESISEFILEN
jgi:type II restriction enzyme